MYVSLDEEVVIISVESPSSVITRDLGTNVL